MRKSAILMSSSSGAGPSPETGLASTLLASSESPSGDLVSAALACRCFELRTLVERCDALESLELMGTSLFLDDDPAACAAERCTLSLETHALTLRHLVLLKSKIVVLDVSNARIQRLSEALIYAGCV